MARFNLKFNVGKIAGHIKQICYSFISVQDIYKGQVVNLHVDCPPSLNFNEFILKVTMTLRLLYIIE